MYPVTKKNISKGLKIDVASWVFHGYTISKINKILPLNDISRASGILKSGSNIH